MGTCNQNDANHVFRTKMLSEVTLKQHSEAWECRNLLGTELDLRSVGIGWLPLQCNGTAHVSVIKCTCLSGIAHVVSTPSDSTPGPGSSCTSQAHSANNNQTCSAPESCLAGH